MDRKKSIEDTARQMLGDVLGKDKAPPSKPKKKQPKMKVTFKGQVGQVINGDVYGNTFNPGTKSDGS